MIWPASTWLWRGVAGGFVAYVFKRLHSTPHAVDGERQDWARRLAERDCRDDLATRALREAPHRVNPRLEVFANAEAVARAAARFVSDCCALSVAERGSFHFAVSGGATPQAMFTLLRQFDLPWEHITVYQVDERVAPLGDAARNLTRLSSTLIGLPVRIVPMPVDGGDALDLDAAAGEYARLLPDEFDLVHLGLGADGHTASLVPGDPVLEVSDRRVAVTAHPYQARRRMTLTYTGLAAARQTLWLVTGVEKHHALEQLLAGDRSIPAGRVDATDALILADVAAVQS